jgi:hypothetical protein
VQSRSNGCEQHLFEFNQSNTRQAFHIVNKAVQPHHIDTYGAKLLFASIFVPLIERDCIETINNDKYNANNNDVFIRSMPKRIEMCIAVGGDHINY